jgi:hypothetical protein
VEAAPEQRADSEMTPSKDKNGEASSMIPVSDEVLFARFKVNPPGSSSLIAQSQARLSFTLPLDYVQFLHRMNGGEGFLGEHAYVALWRVEELRERNAGYEVAEFAPGLFLFGSNGGGRGVCVRYSLRSISNCCRPLYRDGQLGRRGRYSDKLQSLLILDALFTIGIPFPQRMTRLGKK